MRQLAFDVVENLDQVSCTESTGHGNDFQLIPTVKMETRRISESNIRLKRRFAPSNKF